MSVCDLQIGNHFLEHRDRCNNYKGFFHRQMCITSRSGDQLVCKKAAAAMATKTPRGGEGKLPTTDETMPPPFPLPSTPTKEKHLCEGIAWKKDIGVHRRGLWAYTVRPRTIACSQTALDPPVHTEPRNGRHCEDIRMPPFQTKGSQLKLPPTPR
jgi:hypothetical protein